MKILPKNDKFEKLDKVLSEHSIHLIYDETEEDDYFQSSISPWFEFSYVTVPVIFDIQNENHLVTVFHEIGHLLNSKTYEKFTKSAKYSSNGEFINTMKDEIGAWKIGIKLYKETYNLPISEKCFLYIVDCLMTYYNHCVNLKLKDNILPLCSNPKLKLMNMFK